MATSLRKVLFISTYSVSGMKYSDSDAASTFLLIQHRAGMMCEVQKLFVKICNIHEGKEAGNIIGGSANISCRLCYAYGGIYIIYPPQHQGCARLMSRESNLTRL